jgi:hypothetical protein
VGIGARINGKTRCVYGCIRVDVDVLVEVDGIQFFSPNVSNALLLSGDLLDYARRRVYSGGFSDGGFPCQGP